MTEPDDLRTLRITDLRDTNLAVYVGQLVLGSLMSQGNDAAVASAWADQVVLLMLAGRKADDALWEAVIEEYAAVRQLAKLDGPAAQWAYVLEGSVIHPTLEHGGPARRAVEKRCPICSCYPSRPFGATGHTGPGGQVEQDAECGCDCHG